MHACVFVKKSFLSDPRHGIHSDINSGFLLSDINSGMCIYIEIYIERDIYIYMTFYLTYILTKNVA